MRTTQTTRRGLLTLAGAVLGATGLLLAASPLPARAADAPQITVDKATTTLQSMLGGQQGSSLKGLIHEAKGVLIFPTMVKGGFIVGGQIGDGVILGKKNGAWSDPGFVTFYAGSIGLQIGVEASQVIFVVMKESALKAMVDSKFQFGASAGVSVGTIGGGVGAGSSTDPGLDIYVFSSSAGLFGGGALEGAYLQPDADQNSAYYKPGVQPHEIILDASVRNPGAARLTGILAQQ